MLDVQYSLTTDGRPFVLVDDGQANRIIVFGTDRNLERYNYLYVVINSYLGRFSYCYHRGLSGGPPSVRPSVTGMING
jgi:hypothetical protein